MLLPELRQIAEFNALAQAKILIASFPGFVTVCLRGMPGVAFLIKNRLMEFCAVMTVTSTLDFQCYSQSGAEYPR